MRTPLTEGGSRSMLEKFTEVTQTASLNVSNVHKKCLPLSSALPVTITVMLNTTAFKIFCHLGRHVVLLPRRHPFRSQGPRFQSCVLAYTSLSPTHHHLLRPSKSLTNEVSYMKPCSICINLNLSLAL